MSRDKKTSGETRYVADMYRWYIEQQLAKHPNYFTKYDDVLKMKGFRILMKMTGKKQEIVMTYTLFRSILEKCNLLIIKTIIEGEKVYLGNSLGHIQASRIERNYNKKTLNYLETMRLRKERNDDTIKVYYTGDSYCRISWKKLRDLINSKLYRLEPSKDFRATFSNSLKADPNLQYSFQYYPKNY